MGEGVYGMESKLATSNNKLVIRDGFTKGAVSSCHPFLVPPILRVLKLEAAPLPKVLFCVCRARDVSSQGTITSLC